MERPDKHTPPARRAHRRRTRWRQITGLKTLRDAVLFLLGTAVIVREVWSPPADPSLIVTGLTLTGLPAALSRDERPPRR
ncbi:hypothetical protein LN042_18940 [Kitasatospora sp. RB6PN24]|uniref:hypothetical protein n=1 Tax=Kitasatospora humi TaxID=2893891 RepID=UPI001E5D3046|nr:hypothetical protein [Kitasatospora humi]MCC9309133.1 hypothetical protein [Kitasatospora humi]